ncbi:hypothetical protein [Candidatus Azobacteroides pseudotrichonymphae]|uniref:Uncharacterized protein n=1 Tax=Azobacteroides pseudotrichonymphae genomovar. CFP2 TaxID=511995 RepID=B6YS54_AZOPC|nr:hypothetical protein [Candidatus Azobacteroides pseudotrichonymphae]BAG84026.1 hypothetical protein CFPG_P1-5 [Candidatus Azobacteroides pseudotrichonymphae genomovar. CFP2]
MKKIILSFIVCSMLIGTKGFGQPQQILKETETFGIDIPFFHFLNTKFKYEDVDVENTPTIQSTETIGINFIIVWQTKKFEYELGYGKRNNKGSNVQISANAE